MAAEQENLGGGATIDLFAGKTFRLGERHRVGLYAGVDNLLNRRSIRASGYESSRLYKQNGVYLPLASKYYYAQGINFFFTASYRFR